MNIINTLTLRHLRLNKRRTIVTIIGVILSVSMITAVSTFVVSFLGMMRRSEIEATGKWHVLYKDVAVEKANIATDDKNTESAVLSKDIGYAPLEGSKNEYKPYLYIKSYDAQGFKNFNLKLLEGRFPQKSNELVISSHIAENGGVEYKIGDTLKLKVGKRLSHEGFPLEQESGFILLDDGRSGEEFIVEAEKEYIITGIIERPVFEAFWAPGYTVISYLEKHELSATDTVNISIAWKRVNAGANVYANKLTKNLGIAGENVSYNRQLLRYYGIIGNDLLLTLGLIAAIVITLIIIGSVALIYNSFAISLAERSRHLGMLASVGATKKQKRRSVFFESFIIGLIGIPLGVFFGILGIGITFKLVGPLLESLSTTSIKLILVTSPLSIIIAILLSAITIIISAYIPARRASKVSPIDAIRQSQDIKITGRTVKTSRFTRGIFGFEAELGLKNLKRNSRRYKATVFSLVISIVLFLSVSSLSLLTRKSAETTITSSPYNIRLFIPFSAATDQEGMDFYNAVAAMDNADEYVIEQTIGAIYEADARLIPDGIISYLSGMADEPDSYHIYFQIKAIDEVALKRYANETGIDYNSLLDTDNPRGILINTVSIYQDNKYIRMKHFNIKAGHELKLDFLGDSETSVMIEAGALSGKTPTGETTLFNPMNAVLIVSEKVLDHIKAELPEDFHGEEYTYMYIKSSDSESLIKNIYEYQKHTSIGRVTVDDVEASNRANKNLMTFIFVFFYGFVALITGICVMNILNTISTSIMLRKREFAMLKSVGMTPKGFTKMINYESLFYGIKALLYGLPISFGMMYLIYRLFSNSFSFEFFIPWNSVAVTILAVFAIVGSTMLYSSSKIKKENIIDALKGESI